MKVFGSIVWGRGWILEPGRLAAPDPKYLKLTASSASESVMHRPGIGSYTGIATFVHDFRGKIYYQNSSPGREGARQGVRPIVIFLFR